MANYTRADYRQDVRDNLDDQTEKTWSNDYLNRKIKTMRLDFCSRYNFRFLEVVYSTATTTSSRTIKTSQIDGFNKPIICSWSDNISTRVLKYVVAEDFERALYTSSTTGTPYLYTMQNGDVLLYPKPNEVGTLKVDFKKDPETLPDDDTPDETVPLRRAKVVVDGVTAEAWEKDEEFYNANQFHAKYLAGVKTAKLEEGEKQVGKVPYDLDNAEYLVETDPRRMSPLKGI